MTCWPSRGSRVRNCEGRRSISISWSRRRWGDFQGRDKKDRNIQWNIHPLPTVQADRALLRMVLVNLISNAVKLPALAPRRTLEIGCGANGDGSPGELHLPAFGGVAAPTIPSGETVIFIRDNGAGF